LYGNGFPGRNQEKHRKLTMEHESAHLQRIIRSEPRGPHWIAWVAAADGQPEQSVVLVGMTREEAEEKAKRWGEDQLRSST
jgi:hypothetical protein